ncbi:hypothetical protein G6F24_017102 [Rhizopus arrhizus]|nr:hypothetical protein G6F24_017102 [Rhizopus arrhizus]
MPQVRFWMAIAMAKVSRLQPRSIDTGKRNRPCTWRTPRARPMTMPPASTSSHSRETSGEDGASGDGMAVLLSGATPCDQGRLASITEELRPRIN